MIFSHTLSILFRNTRSCYHVFISLVALTLISFLCISNVYSAQATLSLNPNSESDLAGCAGYKVYYGNSSRNYDTNIDVGTQTSYTVTNLVEGEIYFFAATAYDFSGNESGYSNEVNYAIPTNEIIVDNGEQGTSFTGTWNVSGGSNPFGANSLYANSSATYTFEASVNGTHEVSLWWTYYSNRRTSVPVEIYDGNTLLDTVNVNHLENGGQWNVLGVYGFSGTGRIVINSLGGGTTCADAVKFVPTIPPTITSVSADSSEQVIVVFSEPVEELSATYALNYGINNGIMVYGASLGSDQKSVTLTTSSHIEGTYTLTVNDIEDLASIPNVIAVDTTVSYNYVNQLVVSNLTVASGKAYEIIYNGIQNGALVYIDSTYTYSTIPTLLQGTTYIKTANEDKASSDASFLTFEVNQDVVVYVAHDDRITTKPSWLSSFTDTGDNLVTTDTTLSIFASNYLAGTITLGGNGEGEYSMYTVVIVGQ